MRTNENPTCTQQSRAYGPWGILGYMKKLFVMMSVVATVMFGMSVSPVLAGDGPKGFTLSTNQVTGEVVAQAVRKPFKDPVLQLRLTLPDRPMKLRVWDMGMPNIPLKNEDGRQTTGNLLDKIKLF